MSKVLVERARVLLHNEKDALVIQKGLSRAFSEIVKPIKVLYQNGMVTLDVPTVQVEETRGKCTVRVSWPYQDKSGEIYLDKVDFHLFSPNWEKRTSPYLDVYLTRPAFDVQNPLLAAALYGAWAELNARLAQEAKRIVEQCESDPEIQDALAEIAMLCEAFRSS